MASTNNSGKAEAARRNGRLGGRPKGGALTPRQQQAYDLRQAGKTIREIAEIMGAAKESVRQWIAAAEWKLWRSGKCL